VETRTCSNPTPLNGGADCVGDSTKMTSCDTIPCPIHGGWNNPEWSSCDINTGIQSRTKLCNNPEPAYGGADCVGEAYEEQSCAVDGGWSEWISDPDNLCATECGVESQLIENRTCDNPAPLNGGANCVGDSTKTTTCDVIPCDINGGWSDWQVSNPCKDGNTTKKEVRFCNNPEPSGNGADCVGDNERESDCPFYISKMGLNHVESIIFIIVCIIVALLLGSSGIFLGIKYSKKNKYSKINKNTPFVVDK
jgi:hypothetical protein